MTHTTFFSVGSGTGPTTVAPARVTVSTILRAEVSMTSWSYDLSRMRIFCPAMSNSLSVKASYIPKAALDAVVALLLKHHCSSVNFSSHRMIGIRQGQPSHPGEPEGGHGFTHIVWRADLSCA